MSDWAAAVKGALSYSAQVGGSIWRLGKAVGNFNYQFISAVFRLLTEAFSAIGVFSTALGSAACEIVIYVFEFLVEFGRFLHAVLRLLAQLGAALLHIVIWFYRILEQVAVVIGDLLLHCLRWFGAVTNDLLDYLGVSAFSTVNSLKSASSVCGVWFLCASNYIIECLKSFAETSFSYIHNGLSILYMYLGDCAHQVFCLCASLWQTINSELLRVWKVSWSYINATIPRLTSVFSSQDIYLTIALIVSVIIFLQVIIMVFRNHGLTVPFFGQSVVTRRMNRRILLEWDNARDGFMFVSDEEDGNDDDTTEIEDESDHESIRTNTTNTNTSHTNDDSSDLSDTSSTSFDDEFEIADDSDFESGDENDQNAINIQLPQHQLQYGLRPRVTPSPARSFTKLSQIELEKCLENERDKKLCVVCQDNAKNVLVLPCKHMCMCVMCARHLVTASNRTRRVCPLCRSHIDTVMDVFL